MSRYLVSTESPAIAKRSYGVPTVLAQCPLALSVHRYPEICILQLLAEAALLDSEWLYR